MQQTTHTIRPATAISTKQQTAWQKPLLQRQGQASSEKLRKHPGLWVKQKRVPEIRIFSDTRSILLLLPYSFTNTLNLRYRWSVPLFLSYCPIGYPFVYPLLMCPLDCTSTFCDIFQTCHPFRDTCGSSVPQHLYELSLLAYHPRT